MSIFRGPDLGVDLGTSKFSICVRGEGLAISEAAYIAFRGPELTRSSLIAVGDEAKSMLGKGRVQGERVHVVSPMDHGVIVDSYQAGIILQELAKKAGIRWQRGRRSTLVTALLGASPLERKAFQNVGESLGRSRVVLLDEPLAAANALEADLSEPYAQLVLDVGEGASEAIVVAMGRKIIGRSIRIGGSTMDLAVQNYSRKVHGLILSQDYARELKETVSHSETIKLRGMDLKSQMPGYRIAKRAEIERVIAEASLPIVQMIRELMHELSPDMAVDLIENGIHLCGGASQSFGLQTAIAAATDLTIHPMEAPEAAVIRGCGRILDYVDYFS